MATKTTNYGLTKPDGADFYDVDVQNDNMDIIDKQMKANANDIAQLNSDISGMHFISMKLSGTSDAYGQMWTDNPGIDTYNVKYTDCITNAFMSTDGRYGLIHLEDIPGPNSFKFRLTQTDNHVLGNCPINKTIVLAYKY